MQSVYRLVDGVKAKDLRERLKGLELPDLDAVRAPQPTADNTREPEQRVDAAQAASETPAETVDRDSRIATGKSP